VNESDGIYDVEPSSLADDDGTSWSWQGPCPGCGGSKRVQVADLVATLVSKSRPVVGTDSGFLLIESHLAVTAKARGLRFLDRPTNLRERDATTILPFAQLVATQVLTVRSATREPCGCVSEVDWDPLVVQAPTVPADVYSIDTNPSKVLVSHKLARFILDADPQVTLASVNVMPKT